MQKVIELFQTCNEKFFESKFQVLMRIFSCFQEEFRNACRTFDANHKDIEDRVQYFGLDSNSNEPVSFGIYCNGVTM